MKITKQTITYEAVECENANEAISYAEADSGTAILIDGKYLVVKKAIADALTEAGFEFAYLCDHRGRIVTIPVND